MLWHHVGTFASEAALIEFWTIVWKQDENIRDAEICIAYLELEPNKSPPQPFIVKHVLGCDGLVQDGSNPIANQQCTEVTAALH